MTREPEYGLVSLPKRCSALNIRGGMFARRAPAAFWKGGTCSRARKGTCRIARRLLTAGRTAFTLVELLVVIAVIGVLVALLVPAVQAARESARRAQCADNLRQLGIGLHAYHDSYKTFPSGGWIKSADPTTANMNIGWSAAILPWLEQQPLYSQLNFNVPYNNVANSQPGHTVLPVYLCPSEPRASFWNRAPGDTYDFADADYGGMYGPRGLSFPTDKNNPPRGVMIFNQPIPLSQVRDGSSQTVQIGEAPEAINAMWISGHNIFDECCAINARPPSEFGEELASQHPRGVNTLFADGSIHFLSETIDNMVLSALCTRSGGESAGASY
jgi:prepilin-type N-terminal cleavage/methylation domain-containing protein/prepilin-type processing-associated H-X9-DG protein